LSETVPRGGAIIRRPGRFQRAAFSFQFSVVSVPLFLEKDVLNLRSDYLHKFRVSLRTFGLAKLLWSFSMQEFPTL
jgi:hypothetical protein